MKIITIVNSESIFQKREKLLSKIRNETKDIFNTKINLILLDKNRTMIIDEKLKLVEYLKTTKSVIIDEKFMRNLNLFVTHLLSIHK